MQDIFQVLARKGAVFVANFLRYAIIIAAFVARIGAMGFQTASFGTMIVSSRRAS